MTCWLQGSEETNLDIKLGTLLRSSHRAVELVNVKALLLNIREDSLAALSLW